MSKIREAAIGRDCMVRIPNVCNGNPETVVLAHRRISAAGMKSPDTEGAFCCSACHDALDGRNYMVPFNREQLYGYHCDGIFRTQAILKKMGLIVVPGEKLTKLNVEYM